MALLWLRKVRVLQRVVCILRTLRCFQGLPHSCPESLDCVRQLWSCVGAWPLQEIVISKVPWVQYGDFSAPDPVLT